MRSTNDQVYASGVHRKIPARRLSATAFASPERTLIIPPVTIKEPPKTTGTVAGWLNPILATTCAPNADTFLSDYRSDAAGE
jgi:hypothetical protein